MVRDSVQKKKKKSWLIFLKLLHSVFSKNSFKLFLELSELSPLYVSNIGTDSAPFLLRCSHSLTGFHISTAMKCGDSVWQKD